MQFEMPPEHRKSAFLQNIIELMHFKSWLYIDTRVFGFESYTLILV